MIHGHKMMSIFNLTRSYLNLLCDCVLLTAAAAALFVVQSWPQKLHHLIWSILIIFYNYGGQNYLQATCFMKIQYSALHSKPKFLQVIELCMQLSNPKLAKNISLKTTLITEQRCTGTVAVFIKAYHRVFE